LGRLKLISRHSGLPVRPQVVPALRKTHVAQPADRLQFDDDLVLDQEKSTVYSPTITSS
jgi:hypothetical protein